MKIDGKNPFINLDAYIKNVKDDKKVDASGGQDSKNNAKGDEVVLSPMAKEIQEAKKIIDSMPEIREEKVARLKEQIQNGTYQVDGEKIAGKMLLGSLLRDLT